MADMKDVGDSQPFLTQEGRKSISLMFMKFIAAVLLVGASCYLSVSSFNSFTPEIKNKSSLEKQDALNIRPSMSGLGVKEQHLKKEVCDLSVGEWIPDSLESAYTNESCKHIARYVNCLRNGRPDRGYLHWRWKPSGCDLPHFDPLKFLNAMRGKSLAYIGASICRNTVYSLLCLLSKPIQIHDDGLDFQTMTWSYTSFNFNLSVLFSPYLIHYEDIDTHGDSSIIKTHLHIDKLDSKWTSVYNKHDYVVFSIGPALYRAGIVYENNKVIGCHYCPGLELKELGVDNIYREALKSTLNFVVTSEHKPFVIFRTWTPNHFEDGPNNQRICDISKPYKEGENSVKTPDLKMWRIEIEEFEKAAAIGAKNGVRLELLDTYHLSVLRPDGHPGPYTNYNPYDGNDKKTVEYDCMHWCLPGIVDTWNEMMMKLLLDEQAHDHASVLL